MNDPAPTLPAPSAITRREWLIRSSLLAASGMATVRAATSLSEPAAAQKRPPNLVFFFPDEMRRQAMGFVGEDPTVTPNIDRFAQQGIYLPHATATFPVCTPWRGMMMTGRFPNQTGIVNNANSTRPDVFLHRHERCVTDVLHEAGYHIGYIGKWHLTHPHEPYLPQDGRTAVKWDEFTPPEDRHNIDYWYAYNAYDDHLRPRYWANGTARDQFHYVDDWEPQHDTDVAIRYLENQGGTIRDPNKPFALWVSCNPPHPPYSKVPERYRSLYAGKTSDDVLQRKNVRYEGEGAGAKKWATDYFAAIHGVDEQFGRLLATLQRLGLEENTIVLFTSDHGDMMGSQGLIGKPYPYEEAFSIPMLIRWPGHIQAGRVDDLLLTTPDLMPTLLSMLGCGSRIPSAVQGADRSSLILGAGQSERPWFAPYLDSTDGGHRGVRTHRHTLVLGKRGTVDAVRLFDNQADRYQLHNLADSRPGLVAKLTDATHSWLERVGDPWQP